MDQQLSAGNHTIRMEFFENFVSAVAVLDFGLAGTDFTRPRIGNVVPAPGATSVPTNAEVTASFSKAIDPATLNSSTFVLQETVSGTVVPGVTTFDPILLQAVLTPGSLQPFTSYTVTMKGGPGGIADAAGNTVPQDKVWVFETGPLGLYRINTGGPQVSDGFQRTWTKDDFFIVQGGGQSVNAIEIANTADDVVYYDHRHDNEGYSYQLPVPNGDYRIRLLFANVFLIFDAGNRLDVFIEGQSELLDFNEFLAAGFRTALTRSFTATVVDGSLDIDFVPDVGNANIAGIEVEPLLSTRDLQEPIFLPIPEPEGKSYSTPPSVTISVSDETGLDDGFWDVNLLSTSPAVPERPIIVGGFIPVIFQDLQSTTFGEQFVVPTDVFNQLSIGPHELHFGYTDDAGNANVQIWKFRKVQAGAGTGVIQFTRRTILTAAIPAASAFAKPTTLEFGPDGRLYVGQQNGLIHILSLDADRNVTGVEVIQSIFNTPNFDNDGSPAPGVQGRLLLGLTFDPDSTPAAPILYASHSDPRFCFFAQSCATNNDGGTITRLVGPDFDDPPNRTDLITGLPRSSELHATNAVRVGPDGWLYIAEGSNTNAGTPSLAFSSTPERYLSAALLRANVKGAAASFPIDVRNINGAADLIPGVFEIYATGTRNPYDFVFHSNGNLYLNDNGPNAGSGNTPGPAQACSGGESIDPGFRADQLHIISQGDYAGHPNPARGECILDDGTMYSTPKTPLPNYTSPLLLFAAGNSTNGIEEYKADAFGAQMQGNLISATWAGNQNVRRAVLAADGQSVLFEENLAAFQQPLDVTVSSDGTIFVAEHGGDAISALVPAEPGRWTTRQPMPVGVQEAAVATVDSKVYVFGGEIADFTVDTLYIYDPLTNTWSEGAPMPLPRDHAGVAAVNGKIYVIGGHKLGGGFLEHASVVEYDPLTNTYTPRASMPLPRISPGTAAIGNLIYVAGGYRGSAAVSDFAVYDVTTDTWTSLPPMSTPRDHFQLEAVDGKLYAIGGRPFLVNSVLDTVEIYDPVTQQWTTGAPMPTPRGGVGAGVMNGKIIVFGGEGPSGTPTNTYAATEQYDPATNSWLTLEPMLTPRHGTDGAVIGTTMFVPGGGPTVGVSVT
ncbi:MAG: Ig-like domain-containing protein, partial [Planctomycetes bacterium]|nr:Ig-like domain-containing protein [Planctomycetota bacterium]